LNIDGSRIGALGGGTHCDKRDESGKCLGHENAGRSTSTATVHGTNGEAQGRWPANVIFDEVTAGLLDEQSGQVKGGTWNTTAGARPFDNNGKPTDFATRKTDSSVGGASRFFYVAKASKRDRNEGLEELEAVRHADRVVDDGPGGENPRNRTNQAKQNFHPTVKPTALMRYLIKLVTPEGGVVLDPFTGSGSTGKAALLDGFQFVGVELTEEYLPIIEGRLRWASEQVEDDGTLF
jgi:site-specific DNA-methyltransferase (adenine-specific)